MPQRGCYRFAEVRRHPEPDPSADRALSCPFEHTFDHLAEVIDEFTAVVGLKRYAVYVFDYGAPVGFRLALKHVDRITAFITQNGNAYEEGLGPASVRSRSIGGTLPRSTALL